MSDREDILVEALERVRQWANAYPEIIFKPLTEDQVKLAANVLEAKGIDIGALHAMWARHIFSGVERIVDRALAEEEDR